MRQVYAQDFRHNADKARSSSLPVPVPLQHKYLSAAAGPGTSRSVPSSLPPTATQVVTHDCCSSG